MKTFSIKVTVLALPLMILLIAVNYFGDAAKLFANDYSKKIATMLNEGNFVTNISNYNERNLQLELINNLTEIPDIVVMGSSTTLLINSQYYSSKSLFNNSVSGASMEDLIAIYQIYKQNNILPEKILLGIDPWTFNENNGQDRWRAIETFYYRFVESNEVRSQSFYKYKELVSISYFQSSIKYLPNVLLADADPKPTVERQNNTTTKLTDGSLVYGNLTREATVHDVEIKARTYCTGSIYSIENFDSLSQDIWADFERLIDDMKTNNITVELILAPYHPIVYDQVKAHYKMVLKAENEIVEFAHRKNIKLRGSYDPHKLDMDETYFYDGMHCKERGIDIILTKD